MRTEVVMCLFLKRGTEVQLTLTKRDEKFYTLVTEKATKESLCLKINTGVITLPYNGCLQSSLKEFQQCQYLQPAI